MLPDFLQALFRGLRRSIYAAICLGNLHRQERQPLADIVVQVPRDAAALILLCFDQLTAYLFKGLLSLLLVRSINGRADETRERSVSVYPWRRNIEHPAVDSVVPAKAVLSRKGLVFFQALRHAIFHISQIVWMDVGGPAIAVSCIFIRARKRDSSLIQVDNLALRIAHPDQ